MTNLKTHLKIKISKRQTFDGKPETYGGAYEDWLRSRFQAGATRGVSDRCVERASGQDDQVEGGAQRSRRGDRLCASRGHVTKSETEPTKSKIFSIWDI